MPLVAAAPLITGALGVGASLYGAHKQSQAQSQALNAQERARQEQLAYARQKEAATQKRQSGIWGDYIRRLQGWAQTNPDAAKKYGYRTPGFRSEWLTAPSTANTPGAAASIPGGGQVTLSGGRTVPADEYARYVARRDQQPQTLGQIMGGIQT